MTIVISRNDKGNPPGKLAEAEIRFDASEGALEGLKLIGFAVWERRGGTGRNVTFPARQYSVNGERRSFSLLRATDGLIGDDGMARVRALVLQAYADHEESIGAADPDAGERATEGAYSGSGACS